MTLALFDLDNTLLNGDSDYEWGQFLVRKNLVNAAAYEQANHKFYEQYKQGNLDIYEFCAFTFKFLSTQTMEQLAKLHKEFMQSSIFPLITEKAKALVNKHRLQGDILIVITATNSFITRPIADAFGIEHLIATEPEIINGRYTTEISGTPCFQQGKVIRLKEWLDIHNQTMHGSTFYSDSHNDIPLLELADTAITVDPDEILYKTARDKNWPVISLK